MKILFALGRLFYDAQNFTQALEYFAQVEDDSIGNDFTQQLLSVYMQTKEFDRAAKLIHSKRDNIQNSIIFESLNQLIGAISAASSKQCDGNATVNLAASLSEIAYSLLMENFFSKELLDFVLENFEASYAEWAELSQVIDEDNRFAPALDAKVLESALNMACFDQNAQKAFTRIYQESTENPASEQLISEFVELAAFEMLANSARPNYDVLNILEKIYHAENRPILLTWALSATYLAHNITTFQSEEITRDAISAMENEGILFPIFKESKSTPTPFIEKYQPFMYKTLPNKDCWLYYKINEPSGTEFFTSIPMQYVRYGIYVAAVPMFYNESFTYYFSEEMPSGSITTKEATIKNIKPFLHEDEKDPYFTINNAIINEQMFKHDQAEKLISTLIKDIQPVRAGLL